MDILRTLHSSWTSINRLRTRMGNEQSHEKVLEDEAQQEEDDSFNLDDIPDSRDPKALAQLNSQPTNLTPPDAPDLIPETPKNSQDGDSASEKGRLRGRSHNAKTTPTVYGAKDVDNSEAEEAQSIAVRSNSRSSDSVRRVVNGDTRSNEDLVQDEGSQSDTREINTTAISSIQSPGLRFSQKSHESGTSGTQSRSKDLRGTRWRGKFLCPKAETYVCDEIFTTAAAATRHARTHGVNTDMQCPVCGKGFDRKSKLDRHKLIHNRSKVGTRSIADQISTGQNESEVSNAGAPPAEGVPGFETDRPENLAPQVVSIQEIPTGPAGFPEAHGTELIGQQDQSSEQQSNTSASIFDEPADIDTIEETPRLSQGLKRRRDMISGNQLLSKAPLGPRKRRRRNSLSPPTSQSSDDNMDTGKEDDIVRESKPPRNGQLKMRPLNPNSKKAGTLSGFVQPLKSNPKLSHPLYNPRHSPVEQVQHVEDIIVPRTVHAGASKRSPDDGQRKLTLHSSQPTPLAQKTQQALYTSPKGKRKAESGISYSSPPKTNRSQDREDEHIDSTEAQGTRRTEMATSVARRTNSKASKRKADKATSKSHASDKPSPDKSSSESDSDSGSDHKPTSRHSSPGSTAHICLECQREFKSSNALQEHRRKQDVHKNLHKCPNCSTKFFSSAALGKHQRETQHVDRTVNQRQKGAFTQEEVDKLDRWRDRVCDEYDINTSTFNQMMTDSSRRTHGFVWPYRYITKDDFLSQYYDVLPHRDRRSMSRYRERHFQNTHSDQKWSKQDDDELVRLHKELGPRWVEIGQRLTRTQDAVSQRWRFKLRYRESGGVNEGVWTEDEANALCEAVEAVARSKNPPGRLKAEWSIPWEQVCLRLDEVRTAQQCSNKWRLMHQIRKGGKFIKPAGMDRMPNTPSSMATPSRMTQRLSGQDSSASGRRERKVISDYTVQESDEEVVIPSSSRRTQNGGGIVGAPTPSTTRKRSPAQSRRKAGAENGDPDAAIESPDLPRNLFGAKTPQNGASLSQIFNGTQANTSALRMPNVAGRQSTQTERPSPNVAIQARPESSPLRMIDVDAAEQDSGSDDNSDEDSTTDKGKVQTGATKPEQAVLDVDSEEQEDEEEEDIAKSSSNIKVLKMEVTEASDDNSSTDDSSESEDEEGESSSSSVEQEESDQEQQQAEADTSSDEGGEDEDEDEDDNDSMVQDTRNDSWMQSIRDASQKRRATESTASLVAKRRAGLMRSLGRAPGEAEDDIRKDSDSSDGGEVEDIAHH